LLVLLSVAMVAAGTVQDMPVRFVDGEAHALTPAGLVPLRCVTELPLTGAHIREVDPKTGELRIDIPNRKGIMEPTFVPPCKNWTLGKTSPPAPDTYDGWLAYTSFNVPTTFETFLGYFSVPPAPQSDPEVLYVFTGLQNVNWIPLVDPPPNTFDIIQPVLQYQAYAWGLRSWYVTLNNGVQVSQQLPINAGDNIFGNMTRLSGNTWYIGGTGASGTTSLTVDHAVLKNQPWSYTTVECYGCSGCSTEPTQPIQFTKMTLTDSSGPVTADWKAFQSPSPICNTRAKIDSPSAVTFEFGY